MAHTSGYGGIITFTTYGGSTGPGWSAGIEDWRLQYAARQHEVTVQGSAVRSYEERTFLAGLLHAEVTLTFLVPQAMPTSEQNWIIAWPVDVKLAVYGSYHYRLFGKILNYNVDSPLDGPVRARARVVHSNDGSNKFVYSTT